MSPHEVLSQLQREIPITKVLGFSIQSLSEESAICSLPLNPNINHKGTLFGGSQYSGCALACYSLFLFNVRQASSPTNNIVVAGANIKYLKPAPFDVRVKAFWKESDGRSRFLEHLERKGKARVSLLAHVLDGADLLLTEFQGDFVVFQ